MEKHLSQKCKTCNETLPISMFHKDKHTLTGFKYTCKDCTKKKKDASKRIVEIAQVKKEEPENEEASTKKEKLVDNPQKVYQVESGYPEFDFEEKFERGKHYALGFPGSRNSGKTTTLSYVWPFIKDRYDIIILFTNSTNAPIYKTFLDDLDRQFVFDDFKPEVLKDMEKFQKLTENGLDWCIIFDDCSSMKHKNADEIMQLFIRGRNEDCTVMFLTQSIMFLNPNVRANIDYAFFLRCRTPSMKVKIIDNFIMDVVPVPPEVKTKSQKYEYYSQWLDTNCGEKGQVVVVDFLNDDQIYSFRVPMEFVDNQKVQIAEIESTKKKRKRYE